MTDPRTTKLEWIRDGLKWIVGIASGLLTLSATYFYDRFDQAPRFAPALCFAWVLLILATLAGILATLSTWKNIEGTGAFGRYLTIFYGTAMWSFTIGFTVLAGVLVANVATSRKTGEVTGLFLMQDSLPSFEPASASPADARFGPTACAMREQLANAGSLSALVVGRYDRRELSDRAQSRFATNLDLAQQRAERIAKFLTDSTVCKARPMLHVVTLTSSWRHDIPPGFTGASANALLAADRRVEVYGFHVKGR